MNHHNNWQVRNAKSHKRSLPCFPSHSRRRNCLLHYNADGDHLEGRDWGICIAKSKKTRSPPRKMRRNIKSLRDFIIIMHRSWCTKDLQKFRLQWYAGNLACKGLMMVRTGGYILSSLMLIVLSIDRWEQGLNISISISIKQSCNLTRYQDDNLASSVDGRYISNRRGFFHKSHKWHFCKIIFCSGKIFKN